MEMNLKFEELLSFCRKWDFRKSASHSQQPHRLTSLPFKTNHASPRDFLKPASRRRPCSAIPPLGGDPPPSSGLSSARGKPREQTRVGGKMPPDAPVQPPDPRDNWSKYAYR